jgi:hypothetical protein
MKNKIFKLLFIALLGFTSCEDSLDVINENEPDFKKVYASGDDVLNVAAGLYNSFYTAELSYYGVQMMLATAADNASCSWGNSGMRDMSWEPRKAWTNTPGYPYRGNTKYTFDRMYGVINTASLVLKAIDGGIEIGSKGAETQKVKAFAKLNMGMAYGVLATVFDRAFIVDEKTSIEDATVEDAVSFAEVGAQAVKYLDEAIALSGSTFEIPASWMGTSGAVSNLRLAEYANSWAARIMSNLPRNSTQNNAVDWNKVLSYANKGLSSDWNVQQDGFNQWYAMAGDYLTYPGWGVVDMYVVNKLDPSLPAHWEDDVNFPAPAASSNPTADNRILTDFSHLASNWLRPDRGYYHWSNYRFSRYDDVYATGEGKLAEFMKAENDLYKAEASAQTGNLANAAAIINAGTRTSRGKLPEVSADKAKIMAAIHHERVIELMVTGAGLQFFEMRKNNFLQKGTPLHLPIPAQTLETFGEAQPFYTFGGPSGADGENGSSGGWR